MGKMAAILQTTLSNAFSWMKSFDCDTISMKFVPKGLIDNKSVLVQVMNWHRTGCKPLSEPMAGLTTGAYMLAGYEETEMLHHKSSSNMWIQISEKMII